MRSQLLHESAGQRTFVIVFDPGEEAVSGLTEFARIRRISAASLTAIGAFSSVTVGYFEMDRRDYRRLPLDEQVEVVALMGNIAHHRDEPKIHAHVVVGRADGTALAGHLLEGRVQPTLEVVLAESPAHLRREIDERTGLPLIRPESRE